MTTESSVVFPKSIEAPLSDAEFSKWNPIPPSKEFLNFINLPDRTKRSGVDREYMAYILLIWLWSLKTTKLLIKRLPNYTIEIVDPSTVKTTDLENPEYFEVTQRDCVALCLYFIWPRNFMISPLPCLSKIEQRDLETGISDKQILKIFEKEIHSVRSTKGMRIASSDAQKRMMSFFLKEKKVSKHSFFVTTDYIPLPLDDLLLESMRNKFRGTEMSPKDIEFYVNYVITKFDSPSEDGSRI